MSFPFKTIVLIGKHNSPEIRDQMLALVQFLVARSLSIVVEANTAERLDIRGYPTRALKQMDADIDLAIVVGGDGSMLTAGRGLMGTGIPLVGINRGKFGFLTDISSDEMLPAMEKILAGEYTLEQRIMLCVHIERDGKLLSKGRAFNDVVVSKGDTSRLIEMTLAVDGQVLNRQRSDGMIVATPTGTTAYSLSAGGPVLHPTLDAIAIVPICPHTFTNRPITINSASKIEITFVHGEDARVHVDGLPHVVLQLGDKVQVRRDERTVTLLHPVGHSHYEVLRQKLHWG
jgi:NAD+ kinase